MISLLWPFSYSCIQCLFSCLFLCEYFGNQASLTNCSGTLIRLTDSTASAPPVRRNKGSFQRVSFLIIHMSWVTFTAFFIIYFSVIFPWKVRNFLFYLSSYFNEFILFNLFRWNSLLLSFCFVDLFVYLFVIIRLSIRIFLYFGFSISLFLFLILSSCLAVLIYYLFRIRYFC